MVQTITAYNNKKLKKIKKTQQHLLYKFVVLSAIDFQAKIVSNRAALDHIILPLPNQCEGS